MQAAKDSFYVEWRNRLSDEHPERTVVVGGVERPAIVVPENEGSEAVELEETFRLHWGECTATGSGSRLMKMDCTVRYATRGTDASNGDRGRALGAMDGELTGISQPPRTMKMDYTVIPAKSQGTMLFWTEIEFGLPKDVAGRMEREAKTTVYFLSSAAEEVKP